MAGKEKIDGATSVAFRENHKRIREERDMTWAQESRFLKKLGWHLPPLALRRLEEGERRIDVDDLMAIALVLDVSPLDLLLPSAKELKTSITGASDVSGTNVREWAMGEKPLHVPSSPFAGVFHGMSTDQPFALPESGETFAADSIDTFLESEKFKSAVRKIICDETNDAE